MSGTTDGRASLIVSSELVQNTICQLMYEILNLAQEIHLGVLINNVRLCEVDEI